MAVAGFVLAAGEGRRLRPATLVRPKALVPFCGVPVLELALARLAALPALRSVVVNAWHQADQIEVFCAAAAGRWPMPVRVSREERLLDTGGGLRRGLALVPEASTVLVHNADVLLDVDLAELLRVHRERGAAATVLLVPGRGPQTVELAADGRIMAFRRPPAAGQFTFAGVYVLERPVLEFLPAAEVCSIVPALAAAAAAGLPVLGLDTGEAFWSDLGRPESYIRAHGEVADRGLRWSPRLREAVALQARRRAELERSGVCCTGALGLGAELHVPAGAHLHNVVLWDGTELPRPLLYADAVFTGGMVAPPPVEEARQPDPRLPLCLGLPPAAALAVEPLRKQGSGRRYARLRARAENGGERTWIWCAYAPERRENAAFAALADFLERLGLNIPEVQVHLGDVGEIVTTDLGGTDLAGIADPAVAEPLLADVLRQVARLHVLGDRAARLEELPLQNGFTKGLYDWERDYFREHILERLLVRPELWSPAVAAEWCGLRTLLLEQPLVPVHRDLQSANIMLCAGRPYLIDFQGMRLGCAAYDVASLLYDPYLAHPAERRRRLWVQYFYEASALGGRPPPERVFHAAAVQRLLQALGAYGKLWRGDGLDWYRPFILPALGLLGEAAAAAACPRLAGFAAATAAECRPCVGG